MREPREADYSSEYPDVPIWMRVSELTSRRHSMMSRWGYETVQWTREQDAELMRLVENGMDNTEIAEYFGFSTDRVRKRIARLRTRKTRWHEHDSVDCFLTENVIGRGMKFKTAARAISEVTGMEVTKDMVAYRVKVLRGEAP